MTIQQPKRKVGRPRVADRDQQRGKRRFYMLEKNDRTIAFMKTAHLTHRQMTGKDASDAEILRAALAFYSLADIPAENE